MELKQIGRIEGFKYPFKVKINEEYKSAMVGLEGFSHCIVIWWADKCDNPKDRKILDCEKPYKKGPEKLGIFSTRSPARPNPIASTVVKILSISKNGTIKIPYIDAYNGTPVLDIKPYHPSSDKICKYNLPDWCKHWPKSLEESAKFNWEEEFNF
jgi:tRNA-Thr(GGU) m(6)t(6)A37 methyltransferase TsaA